MIKLKINKFLTEIDANGCEVYVKTPIFKELTGIDDVSELQRLEDSSTPLISKKEEKSHLYVGGLDIIATPTSSPDYRVDINGHKCSIKKLLEACDLNLELFASAIRAASFLTINRSSEIDMYQYLSIIKYNMMNILDAHIDAPMPERIGGVDVYRKRKMSPEGTAESPDLVPIRDTQSSRDFVDWSVIKTRHISLRADYGNREYDIIGDLMKIDGASLRLHLHKMAQKINILYANMPLYMGKEQLFLQPVTPNKLNNIIARCLKYVEPYGPLAIPKMHLDHFVETIMSECRKGMSQGVILLMDTSGCVRICRIEDIEIGASRDLKNLLGKYGSEKILNWSLDATKEIY